MINDYLLGDEDTAMGGDDEATTEENTEDTGTEMGGDDEDTDSDMGGEDSSEE